MFQWNEFTHKYILLDIFYIIYSAQLCTLQVYTEENECEDYASLKL